MTTTAVVGYGWVWEAVHLLLELFLSAAGSTGEEKVEQNWIHFRWGRK